eukprot:CAMPEP_0194159214 /NCGR_PEP_ID=MMETSP0152-20130528/77704_1 /TAXON_ID=1049557 /ORGANISM="Thalassiothrix antarctica, Strain L6-D1" /LENGTH=523 /DNA_ID=CAMNT_0038868751 /DNA_START=58 /DNA_END=1629 /DNA_ORIENTATION=-
MIANDKKKRSLIEAFAYFCLLSSFLFVLNKTYNGQASVVEKNDAKKTIRHRTLVNRESDEPEFVNEEQYIEYLSKKLTPQHLNTYPTTSKSGEENRTALQHHQFLHLHHMKTGGTSMDGLLQCAIRRLRKTETEGQIAYMNLHECSEGRYRDCRDGENSQCRQRINESAILSYCAPESDELEFVNEEQYIEYLSKKLTPQHLNTYPTSNYSEDNRTALQHHQFLHLHHMKTGGTSMNGLLQCAISRSRKTEKKEQIAYMNVQECSEERYRNCRDGADPKCRERINESAILSYCAPLMDLKSFGWAKNNFIEEGKQEEEEALQDFSLPNAKPHAVTVLRHPVSRIWSMFRFRTKSCYSCTPLIDVYKLIDANQTENMTHSTTCITQLLNHQTRNLVSSQHEFDTLPDHELIEDALYNIKNYFTMIGLTEEMNDTAKMVGKVFPWMAETIPGSNLTCAMPHRNASPQNNRCGPNNTHWELPPHPDNETLAAIIAHNQLDMILYEQTVQQFHYQKVALDLDQAITE